MRRTRRTPLIRHVASALALLMLGACASSTQVDGQWADPQVVARGTLQGARVMVACDASEPVVKQICQEQLASELVARGATPVVAPDIARSTPAMPVNDEQYLAAARNAGAKAVLATTVSIANSDIRPPVSIGIGGFGIGRHSGGGVGIDVPIGGGGVRNAYTASGRLTDAATGKLLWTARATSPTSGDLNSQMSELARAVVGAADKAGLF
ncbi:MAG TPA: hypothetical protein VFP68_10485 [Burkholderiaceae bacterium]|nr:hypothetical protein [Burkholderiaceae bacterium]